MKKVLGFSSVLALGFLLLTSANLLGQDWWGAINTQFPAQDDDFIISFDVVPRGDISVGRAHITLSNVIPAAWGDNACIVRFVVAADSNHYVDIRNGGTYEADVFYGYSAATSYHVVIEVQTSIDFYGVTISELPSGEEVIIKDAASFRSDQAGVGQLQYINVTIPYADTTNAIDNPGAELKNIKLTNFDGEVLWENEGTNYESTGVAESLIQTPNEFELATNYPNPFNPSTNIEFTLQEASKVKMSVYNMLGQEIATLVDQIASAGSHTVKWNGTNAAGNKVESGVYFYQLQTVKQTITHKMLLMK